MKALTEKQKRLVKKHGTPQLFAKACWNALDMITPNEAQTAIDKYCQQFKKAGTPNTRLKG